MKVIKTIEENEQEGFLALIGQKVTIFCSAYIYAGELVGVNDTCIKLKNASIVYETGPLTGSAGFKDAQALPNDWYIQCSSIESFGILK